MVPRSRPRYWLHILLFLFTLATTTIVGTQLAWQFQQNAPTTIGEWFGLDRIAAHPAVLLQGLIFSLPLLLILLAHEFGHYLVCVHYNLDASLPYFLPAPTLIGTFGAFIRIRSHIYSKRQLFDVGIAGPIAGFVVLVPFLLFGLAQSRVVPGIVHEGAIYFGVSLGQRVLHSLLWPGVPLSDLSLHPMARAAWVGLFATALNLLPIGQLDGGHILYALIRRQSKVISTIFIIALVPLGYFYHYWPWYLYAAVLFFLGRRHPYIYDPTPIGPVRQVLGILALLIFLFCFMPVPVWLA